MGTSLSKETILSLYREMMKIRGCEERFAVAHAAGLVHGACHTYVGEEAIAVGGLRASDRTGCGVQYAPGSRPRSGEGCASQEPWRPNFWDGRRAVRKAGAAACTCLRRKSG